MAKQKKTSIPCVVNQNFYSDVIHFIEPSRITRELKNYVGYSLTTKDLTNKDKYSQVKLFSFNNLESKEEKLVFELCKKDIEKDDKKETQYFVKTGLYTGVIYIGNLAFHIDTGYDAAGNQFLLRRMLRYANNIFIENDDKGNADKNNDNSGFPLFEFLFLTSLQKASILGFPQEYNRTKYHELKVHGNVDVGRYITNDIPFKGKISSVKNERRYVQCIVDVLYFALKTVHDEIKKENFTRLSFVKSELQASYSGRRPNAATIRQALNHKALCNPMYAEFKKTLKYAEIVLQKHDMLETENVSSTGISGYLMDVSSLWEAYLAALLRQNFPDWNVRTQEELKLYNGSFFARSNYPDIVMEKDGYYAILDAKFKHMRLDARYDDVDRTDLFQINSYAGYYNLKYPGKVKLCGLIYPLSVDIQDANGVVNSQTRLNHLYGLEEIGDSSPQNQTKFIIDGVYVGPKNILEKENEFINRLKSLLA